MEECRPCLTNPPSKRGFEEGKNSQHERRIESEKKVFKKRLLESRSILSTCSATDCAASTRDAAVDETVHPKKSEVDNSSAPRATTNIHPTRDLNPPTLQAHPSFAHGGCAQGQHADSPTSVVARNTFETVNPESPKLLKHLRCHDRRKLKPQKMNSKNPKPQISGLQNPSLQTRLPECTCLNRTLNRL